MRFNFLAFNNKTGSRVPSKYIGVCVCVRPENDVLTRLSELICTACYESCTSREMAKIFGSSDKSGAE
ncbi:hypothetical protein L596_013307 [Steinernema carpocapsae]|uniref:Uncharacterized protein n=1 Tax=Steinernema carpocapsae TaxID=34508 RepID=A0A4V6XWG2_STECR|nr:hypothetical protein L596_013307 [Steinernema carpocapsae]